MDTHARNHLPIERYEKVVRECYAELKDEEMIGSFMVPTTREPELPRAAARKKPSKRKTNNQEVVGVPDIRTFFYRIRPPTSTNGNKTGARATQNQGTETGNEDQRDDCIIID